MARRHRDSQFLIAAEGLGQRVELVGAEARVAEGDQNFRIATLAPAMLFLPLMADPRALDAVRRIERALARIESAASRPPPTSTDATESGEEFQRLREAHDALRRQVAGAIGQIDRMIETGERR